MKILSELKTSGDDDLPDGVSYFKSEKWHKKLLEKAEYYNSVPGNLGFYDCKKCNNKGVIEYITDEWDESCKVCECMKIRACYQAMAKSGITEDMIKRFRFDNFSVMKDYQTQMKMAAQRYAQSDLKGWLMLSGQSGTGKTHLCTAVCKYLLSKGHTVKYVLWHDVARKLQALRYKIDEYEAYIHEIADAEVLYIDDLFKADKSTGPAFELLNQRYISRRPTIISTEVYMNEMIQMDEAMASRIAEMTKGFIVHTARDAERNFRTAEVTS